jgi:XTP/dITP diphosphohydrolase
MNLIPVAYAPGFFYSLEFNPQIKIEVMIDELVIGTTNPGKKVVIKNVFDKANLPIRLLTLADFPPGPEVEETGRTFEENAELKASFQARRLGKWVLGDDSGLEVDALGGRPGVYSARLNGKYVPIEEMHKWVLTNLKGVPPEKRGATYVAALALADPTGKIRATFRGEVRGRITEKPRGKGGFGYDSLFEVEGTGKTFAEMDDETRWELSHRGIALQKLIKYLRALRAKHR